jgi:hypothetical protein
MHQTTQLRQRGGSRRDQLNGVLFMLISMTSISTKEEEDSSLPQALPVHMTSTERQNRLERVNKVRLIRSFRFRGSQCCWVGGCCHAVL